MTPGGTTINTAGLGPNTSLGTDVAGIWSLIQALTGSSNTNAASNVALAYPQQSAVTGAVSSLDQFLKDPNSFLKSAPVQSQIQQGVQSASNMAGAAGGANSGGRLAALQATGQNIAMTDENQYVNQLLQTASLGNPVAAASLQQQGQQGQATNMAGGIAGISNIVAQLLGIGGGQSGAGGGLVQTIQKLFSGGSSPGYDVSTAPGGVPVNAATPGTDVTSIVPGSPDFLPGSGDVQPVDWTSWFDSTGLG